MNNHVIVGQHISSESFIRFFRSFRSRSRGWSCILVGVPIVIVIVIAASRHRSIVGHVFVRGHVQQPQNDATSSGFFRGFVDATRAGTPGDGLVSYGGFECWTQCLTRCIAC